MGASLLAVAKSIYYFHFAFTQASCNSERSQTLSEGFILINLIGLFIYFFLFQNVENMFEFAVNARRETRIFFRGDGNIRSPVMIWIDEMSRQT